MEYCTLSHPILHQLLLECCECHHLHLWRVLDIIQWTLRCVTSVLHSARCSYYLFQRGPYNAAVILSSGLHDTVLAPRGPYNAVLTQHVPYDTAAIWCSPCMDCIVSQLYGLAPHELYNDVLTQHVPYDTAAIWCSPCMDCIVPQLYGLAPHEPYDDAAMPSSATLIL